MERFDRRTQTLRLPWGAEEMSLRLPESWGPVTVLEPNPQPTVADARLEARRSLEEPVGSPRLRELASRGTRVAIVIDDESRPTPIATILPAVVEELARAGVERGDITLVTALGVHRPMTSSQLQRRLGSSLSALRCENHDCDDAGHLTDLGKTERGTRVLVNSSVADAGLIVSIGCIEPHLIASFGGGYKNLVPGVAGRETIAYNHGLNCGPETFNMGGRPIERNPMRLDLEEAGRMLRPPVFIVNAVLDGSLEVVRIVSGDPIAAHRSGVAISKAIYGVRAGAPADIVIADSHPMDQDLRQGSKALANTIRAVRRGGVLVVLMRAEEGVGVFGLADRRLPVGRRLLRMASPLLARLVPRLRLRGLADDERFLLYFALQAMRHCRLVVCAPTVPAEQASSFPFAEIVATPAEAVERARAYAGTRATVAVFPHGGSTYPLLDGD